MSPPAATAPAHRRILRRGSTPRAPRRISGPPRPALAGAAAARPPFAMRLGTAAMRVGDARLLDRLVRGRFWIALVAIGLMGIVFMQVSLLKLNSGISRAVTAADTLERQNASLRGDISNLDSGERIQAVAAKLGMIIPAAGDVHYLDGRQADGARAAESIKPPAPVAGAATPVAQQTASAQQQAAPVQQQAPPQQQTAPVQQQTAPVQQQTAPQQQAAPAQQQTAPAQQQPAQTAATTQQAPASTSTGGATTATTAPPAATATAAAGGASAPQGG